MLSGGWTELGQEDAFQAAAFFCGSYDGTVDAVSGAPTRGRVRGTHPLLSCSPYALPPPPDTCGVRRCTPILPSPPLPPLPVLLFASLIVYTLRACYFFLFPLPQNHDLEPPQDPDSATILQITEKFTELVQAADASLAPPPPPPKKVGFLSPKEGRYQDIGPRSVGAVGPYMQEPSVGPVTFNPDVVPGGPASSPQMFTNINPDMWPAKSVQFLMTHFQIATGSPPWLEYKRIRARIQARLCRRFRNTAKRKANFAKAVLHGHVAHGGRALAKKHTCRCCGMPTHTRRKCPVAALLSLHA
jgi:hypothetical protein